MSKHYSRSVFVSFDAPAIFTIAFTSKQTLHTAERVCSKFADIQTINPHIHTVEIHIKFAVVCARASHSAAVIDSAVRRRNERSVVRVMDGKHCRHHPTFPAHFQTACRLAARSTQGTSLTLGRRFLDASDAYGHSFVSW